MIIYKKNKKKKRRAFVMYLWNFCRCTFSLGSQSWVCDAHFPELCPQGCCVWPPAAAARWRIQNDLHDWLTRHATVSTRAVPSLVPADGQRGLTSTCSSLSALWEDSLETRLVSGTDAYFTPRQHMEGWLVWSRQDHFETALLGASFATAEPRAVAPPLSPRKMLISVVILELRTI